MAIVSGYGKDRMRVGFGALTNYNSYKAFGLGLDREIAYYWQRAFKDDYGAFNIPVKLSLPATETVTISWSFSGDAVAGTHFTEIVPDRTADIRNGQQEYLIPISFNGVGKWFKEKELIVTLSSTNAPIVEDQDQVRLIIHASTAPPEITVSTTLTGGFSATIPATFTASYAPQEDITVRYKVSGTAADGVGANTGDATIAAGSTTATLSLPYAGAHASGATVVLSADYERNTVAFTELDWDPDTETFSSSRDVHVDENMWPFSNDVPAIGYDSETQRSAPKPWWPGYPSTLFPDGATLVAGHGDDGDYTVVDIVNQSTGIDRLEDPVTGNSLKYQVPNDNVQSGIPYIRNSFNAQWAGSRSLAHILKPWTRGSIRVVPMVGVDVGKNAKYISISQRVRTQNLNHYATFAWKNDSTGMNTSLTEGVSLNGTTVPVFTAADGTKIWIWQVSRPTPEIESLGLAGAWGVWYGAFEDEHGLGIYHIHNLNPNVEWEFVRSDGSIDIRYETPGVDKGNHIIYPTGIGEDLNDIRTNSKGNLSHSYRTEMSDSVLSGPPTDFWPASGLFWTPWGNAVINPSSTTSLTFTKA